MDDNEPTAYRREQRIVRAINSISAALQNNGRSELPPGTNLRPIAERIYLEAGRDVMEAVAADIREAAQ